MKSQNEKGVSLFLYTILYRIAGNYRKGRNLWPPVRFSPEIIAGGFCHGQKAEAVGGGHRSGMVRLD